MKNHLISITKENDLITIKPIQEKAKLELKEFKKLIDSLYKGALLEIANQHSKEMSKEISILLESFNNDIIYINEEILKNQVNLITWILKDKLIPDQVVLGLEIISTGFSDLIESANID